MNDQFEAMIATMADKLEGLPTRKSPWEQPSGTLKLPGADDLYCGHKDAQGLSWTRKHCPICSHA